jgi:hypothetical protein
MVLNKITDNSLFDQFKLLNNSSPQITALRGILYLFGIGVPAVLFYHLFISQINLQELKSAILLSFGLLGLITSVILFADVIGTINQLNELKRIERNIVFKIYKNEKIINEILEKTFIPVSFESWFAHCAERTHEIIQTTKNIIEKSNNDSSQGKDNIIKGNLKKLEKINRNIIY